MVRREELEALYDVLSTLRGPSPTVEVTLRQLSPPGSGDDLNMTGSLDAALEYVQRVGYAPDAVLHDALEEMAINGWNGGFPIVPQIAIYVCRNIVGNLIDRESI